MSAAEGKAAMAAHAARIAAHYDHARAKHTRFADKLFVQEGLQSFKKDAKRRLGIWRRISSFDETDAESVLMCELAEARHAYARGDKEAAVEECYDAIAVLLRMVDVLEWRQKLGNPYAPNDATNG